MRVHGTPPKITLTFPRALCRSFIRKLDLLSHRIKQVAGVQSVMTRLDLQGNQQLIVYSQPGVSHVELLRRMAAALRAGAGGQDIPHAVTGNPPDPLVGACGSGADQSPCPPLIEVSPRTDRGPARALRPNLSTRIRQWTYGTLAVGAFGMAWIGIVTPGIPTVPFVILAAALAAKSSPALHHRLKTTRVIGPMMRDWEEHRGIRRTVRNQAFVLTGIIVVITLLTVPPSPTVYLLIGAMATFSLVIIRQLPIIPDQKLDSPGSTSPLFSAVA